jgi:predicted ester cyclase
VATPAENKDVVRRYFGAWTGNDKQVFNETMDENFYDAHHDESGRAHVVDFVQTIHDAVADFQIDIEDIIASGNRVCVRTISRATGTQGGKLFGIPTTPGKRVAFHAIHIYEMRDGLICGHWAVEDQLGLLQQLGAVPPPSGPPAGAPERPSDSA